MTPEEFRELYKRTPNSNKANTLERAQILTWLMENKNVYIYSGKMLAGIETPPRFHRIRYLLKPKLNN